MFLFSSPTGAFLISILKKPDRKPSDLDVFVPYRGIPNLNNYKGEPVVDWEMFSSPTGAFLISISYGLALV